MYPGQGTLPLVDLLAGLSAGDYAGPVTLELRPEQGKLTGVCDGQARTCFLHWTDPPTTPARLTVDGEETYAYSTFDGYLSFTVPAGRHRFEVTYDMARK